MTQDELDDDDDLNDREVPATKHHRHHDVLMPDSITDRLADMEIERQLSPHSDLFASVEFSTVSDSPTELQPYTANSYWKLSTSDPSDLPDLD